MWFVPPDDQREVIQLLSQPATYGVACTGVERLETHSAIVFLTADRAFKMKRAVRYDYLDFSTVERRRHFCDAEVSLNRRTAPTLYRRVTAVTRETDGRLALDGAGAPVEWLVEMTRFADDALCDRLAERGRLPLEAMPALAAAVAALHSRATRRGDHGGAAGMTWVVDSNAASFDAFGAEVFPRSDCGELQRLAHAALDRWGALLDERREGGFVRQCHGDLHLRNLVMLEGSPTPFDAIEFNDDLACIDVGYDLSFLLMDLWRRDLQRHANVVLNEYLRLTGDVELLPLLPLFLSCRAAVRAKTSATAAALATPVAAPPLYRLAREYLTRATAFLKPHRPVLVAVGGLSGTGKSTLAAALAPLVGNAPGAWHLRSDVVRKMLLGVGLHDRLDASGYTPATTARVYAGVRVEARLALEAGHSVVCDAVFGDAAERAEIARVATDAGVPCVALWLDAPPATRLARVASRTADASDADADVVTRQTVQVAPPADWIHLDATAAADDTLASALAAVTAAAAS